MPDPSTAPHSTTEHPTKFTLLKAGMAMLLERGYNDLGIQAVLEACNIPKGSFYHHFKSKEDFAFQAVDLYMTAVHAGLDACLNDRKLRPLDRIRQFFTMTAEAYRNEGYLGCMLGGLGQELSGVNANFRRKIEDCISTIAARMAGCLEEAKQCGDLPADSDPKRLASLLVNCWEGAALRSRLQRDSSPLQEMLEFYFRLATSR